MKTYFIVNPSSGKNSALKTIRSLLENKELDYEIITTEYPHHATKIVKMLAQKRGEMPNFCLRWRRFSV